MCVSVCVRVYVRATMLYVQERYVKELCVNEFCVTMLRVKKGYVTCVCVSVIFYVKEVCASVLRVKEFCVTKLCVCVFAEVCGPSI